MKSNLNALEKESKEIIESLLDLMGAGRQKMSYVSHMELMGRMRDCLRHLVNKEYGCSSGLHAGPCDCKGDL